MTVHDKTAADITEAARRRNTRHRMALAGTALALAVASVVSVGGAANAATAGQFSPYLTSNPRSITLSGTDCTATIGFVLDSQSNYHRIGGVTVACSSRHTVSALVAVRYTPTQYTAASTSTAYTYVGVATSQATAATSATFTNAYGFGGRILSSIGVCRGSASYSIYYTGATVTVDGVSYNLSSWGYWNPTGGC